MSIYFLETKLNILLFEDLINANGLRKKKGKNKARYFKKTGDSHKGQMPAGSVIPMTIVHDRVILSFNPKSLLNKL